MRRVIRFGAGLALPAAIAVAWSWARFGTPIDQAERLWWAQDAWGRARGAPMLGIWNLPLNLYTAVFTAPAFRPDFPWFRPTRWGQGILLTSPFLLLAARAPWDRRSQFLWLGAGAALAGPLLFYNNGWVQFGCRFWIQAYPFLFALLARQRLDDRVARLLIALSVAFCGLGLYSIRHGGFSL